MRIRRSIPILLLAAWVGLSGCEALTAPDAREGQMTGVWALRPFQGGVRAAVLGGILFVAADIPQPGLVASEPPYVSVIAGTFAGPGEYALADGDASVMYLVSHDEIGAMYEGGRGMLVIDEVKDGAISGGMWFNTRASGAESPVGSRARFYARFESVPVEHGP